MASIDQIRKVLKQTKHTRCTNLVHNFAHKQAINELNHSKALLENMLKRGLFEGCKKGPEDAIKEINQLLRVYDVC